MSSLIFNTVHCKCGKLSGTVEITKYTLVLNSRHKKDDGMKYELAYNVTGKFTIDSKANLLACAECKGHAYTDADWELINQNDGMPLPPGHEREHLQVPIK